MTLIRVKLGLIVTFMKYFASVISLIFLVKTKNPRSSGVTGSKGGQVHFQDF